ncbi:hypothetical protein L6452_44132 [Arctium lappa]|uniref:Uncharacterized protein n=1 Tax=Arctium lappa TaxID=4217 RepID=A0ACB8XG22_ARCLA|nr:hypothetical protein L6452_44132 [Arctium lappa]
MAAFRILKFFCLVYLTIKAAWKAVTTWNTTQHDVKHSLPLGLPPTPGNLTMQRQLPYLGKIDLKIGVIHDNLKQDALFKDEEWLQLPKFELLFCSYPFLLYGCLALVVWYKVTCSTSAWMTNVHRVPVSARHLYFQRIDGDHFPSITTTN